MRWEVDEMIRTSLMGVFEHLHTHPEISWKEFATRDYLIPFLERAGCRVKTFSDHAGIVADWGNGTPRIGLRGDMDALWQEVDGQACANHSCGHDAHMTMALGTLLNLVHHGSSVPVRLIFQPAEEKGAGALKMMEEHALEGISHFYGVHLRPIQEMRTGKAGPAILHGACAALYGQIEGEDCHAGRPHLGPNAIEVGSALVQALGLLHLDPMVPYSVKVTNFKAGGGATNIIPGNATFTVDLRAQSNEQMRALLNRSVELTQLIAAQFNTKIQVEQHMGTPASEVHDEARDLMAEAIVAALGQDAYHPPVVTGGGDDFHYYTIKQPELKATMLALGCDLRPGLHHPKMQFDHEAMFRGIQILSGTVLKTAERLSS